MAKERTPIGRRGPGNGRKTFWVAIGACLLFGGMALVHTWSRIAVIDRSYQVSRARAENEQLQRELVKQRLEVATLQGTLRVANEAKARLQMARPPPERVVVVPPALASATAGSPAVAQNSTE